VLSGCTAAVDREAAPLASSDALKSNLGSRICVENRSTLPFIGRLEEFDSADPDGAMPPGAVICAEGTRVVGADVVGSLVFSDWSRGTIVRHDYNVSNPWLGEPFVTLFQNNTKQIPNEKIVIGFKCVSDKGLAEGESRPGTTAFSPSRSNVCETPAGRSSALSSPIAQIPWLGTLHKRRSAHKATTHREPCRWHDISVGRD
jgi:hypothetical protein